LSVQASEAKLLKTFGRSTRSLRKQRGLSHEDLTEASALSRNYISDIERGVRNPTCSGSSRWRAMRVALRKSVDEVEAGKG
jgi:transcriptional regulator with XRE-family HTH domain